MDGYIVGSVADLISNKTLHNIKPKKRKFQVNSGNGNENIDIYRYGENAMSNIVTSKVNGESKNSLKFPDRSYLKKSPLKITKTLDQSIQNETLLKKRKKSREEFIPHSTNNEQESDQDTNRDLLSLDHIPSDSEEEEGEGLEKNFNKKGNKAFNKEASLRENTIFVGNIPINYDKQKVCKLFSKFGKIQNARIRCVPVESINMSKKVAAIKKKFNPKRNSLVAYVKYKTLDSANAAVKANGMIIDGHHLRIDLAEQVKERDNNKAVFVGGLPFDIEDDELWEFFQNCGEINSVRIIRDSQTSFGKGFGYVNFNSIASVELALQLNGQELKKRTINVKRCINSRNKNKLNAFGKKKSKEITNQLLCKKGKKFKEEKKKLKKEKNAFLGDFQGKTANMKQKKKKKLGEAALRQRKLVKILGAS